MKYRKKPVVVDAMQLPPSGEDATDQLLTFLHGMGEDWESGRDGELIIQTLEGDMTAQPGDWIIKGVKGEYYPCKPDIFAISYDVDWESTMSKERWTNLEEDQELKLTEAEINDGWHFCPDWDGLLVNRNDKEGEGIACTCE
jgi:hypothetical protein